jgi:hypothetical protein
MMPIPTPFCSVLVEMNKPRRSSGRLASS